MQIYHVGLAYLSFFFIHNEYLSKLAHYSLKGLTLYPKLYPLIITSIYCNLPNHFHLGITSDCRENSFPSLLRARP